MGLETLENEINNVLKNIDDLNFSDLIRSCRCAIGITQRYVAKFLGTHAHRVQHLEAGTFIDYPLPNEITGLSKLYNIPVGVLGEKAYDHMFRRHGSYKKRNAAIKRRSK